MGRPGAPRAVVAAAAAVLVIGGCGGGSSPRGKATPSPCKPKGVVSVGEPIPSSCEFERADGKVVKLSEITKGAPTVLNFWASWCTYCIAEMPTFQQVWSSMGGRLRMIGADLLGVDGETRELAQTFARSTGVTYPLIYDDGGNLYAHFSARLVMPVTIFVGADGLVAHRQFGPLDEQRLRAILKEALGLE